MKKINKENGMGPVKGKKRLIAGGILLAMGIAIVIACVCIRGGDDPVKFSEVKESQMPADITSEIIPEYRTLERALACAIDENIYVVVTRGEKPTSGFNVSVDRIMLKEKNGKSNLIVYALFEDPKKETAISQIITYPTAVVKTDLKTLPDTIELRIQY